MCYLGKENSVDNPDKAQIVIIPVPVEYSTSYGKGTSAGPEAIIDASPYLEFYDEELDSEVWKLGVFTETPVKMAESPEQTLQAIRESVFHHASQNKFPVVLGGEHSISFAVHEGLRQVYPDLSVLQFDAHSDLRDTYEGTPHSHACVMRRIWEKNKNIVEVGIRSQCIEEREFIKQNNIAVYYAHQLYQADFPGQILDSLTENVFITFDTDFFDPSIMPGVGTPEPGGFLWDQTLAFMREVFKRKNVIGFDVVEFSPDKNIFHPDFLLAKFIYKLIGYKYQTWRSE